ncbi:unnamed protein product [Heligmosomoides polygyrus]|uniref:DB domain-containing protein n=1 Tax=Heligmosomoides polygyrus TaxID=6339 RepID=A0A183GKZ5_HELPZ|nr:unnamed protein product [Heligmosomoides polygyrus]
MCIFASSTPRACSPQEVSVKKAGYSVVRATNYCVSCCRIQSLGVLTAAITLYFVNASYTRELEPASAPLTVDDFHCVSMTHAHRVDLASIVMALVSTMTHARAIYSACERLIATGPFCATVTDAREFKAACMTTVANACMKTVKRECNFNTICTVVNTSVRLKTMPLRCSKFYCNLVLHAGTLAPAMAPA